MLLSKHHAELVGKYSFIDKVEIKGAKFIIFYTKEGNVQKAILPRRATIPQLQYRLKMIREELGISGYGKGMNSDVFTTL